MEKESTGRPETEGAAGDRPGAAADRPAADRPLAADSPSAADKPSAADNASAGGAGGAAARLLESRARAVTFFEDRAEVVRSARATLRRGSQWVALDGVSPFADERTVTAKIAGGASSGGAPRAAVNAARVRWRAHEEAALGREEIERLRAEEAAARRAVEDAARARERGDRRVDQINALHTRWASEVAKVAAGVRAPERLRAWRDAWSALGASAEEAHAAIARASEERARAEETAGRAALRLREGQVASPRYQAAIEVDVEAVEDGAEVEIEVTYRVPCALWRPEHLVRLLPGDGAAAGGGAGATGKGDGEGDPAAHAPGKGGAGKGAAGGGGAGATGARAIEILTWATVWHAAGEAWEGVRARFSTARPARDASPPLVRDDVLHLRRKTAEERSRVLVEAREQAREVAGLDRGTRAVDEMPGVDDGGEPLTLESAEPLTIASDGRPHRVEVGRRVLPAQIDRVLFSELGGVAHLRATATLTGAPLLAGPARIARGGALVGRSKLAFVGAGEPFEVGLGPDDGVRARRHVEEQRDTTAIIGTQKIRRKVDVFLSNLSGEPRSLTVTERVPVSEIEDIEITVVEPGDFDPPDPDGFLRASVRLAPQETKRASFTYEIRAKSNVVLPF